MFMLENDSVTRYFLSSNSPQGYITLFKSLYNANDGWKAYILMGGIDSVKSRFLLKAGNAINSAGIRTGYIHSCLDASEIVAVTFPDNHVCVIDGSPPNSFTFEYPCVTEFPVNLCDYTDENILAKERGNIILFSSRIKSSNERAYRFLTAASSLLGDSFRLALECTDIAKLERYAAHISRHEFPQIDRQGIESLRFITAITPDGLINCFDSISSNYRRIYEIDDEFGIGKLFLNKIRCSALSAGYDVISCGCPMFPDGKPEHLLIPSLSLALITTGHNHKFNAEATRHIHIRRFIDREALKLKKPRISFNRKASRELIDQAVMLLGDARASRDMIKSCYWDTTNLDAVDKKADNFIDNLLSEFKEK
jgi:hypothetical protein